MRRLYAVNRLKPGVSFTGRFTLHGVRLELDEGASDRGALAALHLHDVEMSLHSTPKRLKCPACICTVVSEMFLACQCY